MYKGKPETKPATLQCCGQYGKTGHNIRTYQKVEEMLKEENDIEFN